MSDEPSAETFSADAVRWIDGLSDPSGLRGSWRLQMLEHRVTVKETGTDPETGAKTYSREMRPVRLVRFAKGCPWALVPEAERYLLSLAPYTGKIVNGVDIPGTYKPTRTRWIRDDQTNLDDPRRSTNENRHTLVQDLVEASAADGDSVPQSSDCVEMVTAEYHWDEPSLPEAGDLPAASQGTTVSVQQVSRQEDGTYRYAIVTRTAKTRVGTEAIVECTAFQSVTQQDFVNLYGDPKTGFEDEAGHTVEVPSQTCGADGVNVEWRNLRQNDDCTWNVSVVTAAGTAVSDVERTSSETTVERRDTRKDTAQASPLQHVKVQDPATSTAEGHVWEQRSELRPDGLYDNTVTKRDEKQLAGQVVEKRRTIRGTTVRTVNRNMPSAAADPSGIGAVVNTVTDSGRVTQEITEVDKAAQPVDAGSACSTTVFEHVESDRTVQPTKPAKHYRDAGAGHRYEQTSRITEEGSYEVTVEDRQELQKTNAKVTVRKTLRGTQKTIVDRNVASPLVETGLAIGETRDSEVTPGGLYVTTKVVTTAEAAGTIGEECDDQTSSHTDVTTSNVATKPDVMHQSASVNRTVSKSARATEEGTWDVTTRTVTYRPATGSGSAGSAGYTDFVEVGVNATSVSGGAGGVNREVTLSMSPNDHGSYSYTKHQRTYRPITRTVSVASGGYTDTVTVGAHATSTPSVSGGVNREVTLSMSPNDHGSFSFTARKRSYHRIQKTVSVTTSGYTETVTVGAHVTGENVPSSTGSVNQEVTLSMSPNDHGSYSFTERNRTYKPVTNTVLVTAREYTDTVTVGAHVTSVSPVTVDVNKEASLSMSPNDHGSYSFTKHVRSYQTRQLRAQTSHTRFLTRTTVTTVNSKDTTAGIGGEIGSQATISSNGHGGSIVTESTVALEAYDSGWITWRSERKNLQGDWYFNNGLRVFRNQLSVPRPPAGHNIELSFDVNEFGRFDGRMSYSDMDRNSFRRYTAEWLNGDATGGERYVTVFGKTYIVQLRSFFGTGNEQAEALQRVNSILIPGLSLPGRTYVVSARDVTKSLSST